jgi:hypothetical protein
MGTWTGIGVRVLLAARSHRARDAQRTERNGSMRVGRSHFPGTCAAFGGEQRLPAAHSVLVAGTIGPTFNEML